MSRLSHLGLRFFRSLFSRRPNVIAQRLVAAHLNGEEAPIFWSQPTADLDHAVRGALHIHAANPGRRDLVRAFLLHDIGKRHARLGTLGRSAVTILGALRLPVGTRGRAYLDHGATGAVELHALGCEELVVAFAAEHHGAAPTDVNGESWRMLVAADHI